MVLGIIETIIKWHFFYSVLNFENKSFHVFIEDKQMLYLTHSFPSMNLTKKFFLLKSGQNSKNFRKSSIRKICIIFLHYILFFHIHVAVTLMLLVVNLANTK